MLGNENFKFMGNKIIIPRTFYSHDIINVILKRIYTPVIKREDVQI